MMASGDYYMEMCHGDRMKKYIRDLYKPNSDEAKLSVEQHRRLVLDQVGPKRDYLKKSDIKIVETSSASKTIKKDYKAQHEDLKNFKADRKAQMIKIIWS